jgi:hypothetical protein
MGQSVNSSVGAADIATPSMGSAGSKIVARRLRPGVANAEYINQRGPVGID